MTYFISPCCPQTNSDVMYTHFSWSYSIFFSKMLVVFILSICIFPKKFQFSLLLNCIILFLSKVESPLLKRYFNRLLICWILGSNFVVIWWNRSHYREVPRREIFMEQELRFGLDFSQLAVLKKRVWAEYEQLLRVVFSCFQGQKKC